MQFNRRSLLAAGGALVALILIIIVVVVSGGGDDEPEASPTTTSSTSSTTSTTTTTTLPDGPVAPLTGEPIDEDSPLLDQAAVVVKISNNSTVQDNWSGIDLADVVIEERIEDNATRFAVIFHSNLPERVGPIRSGRTSDIDLLTNLGHPILVYSGANPTVTGQLRGLQSGGLVELVVDRGTNVDLVRDTDFRAPDNLFSNLPEIVEKYGEAAGAAAPLFTYRSADDDRVAGDDGPGATVTGQNDVSWVFDEALGYVRVQDGEIHATQDGAPFAFDNVVLLEVEYTPSTFAPGSVDARTVGTGPVTIMSGGEQWTGTWMRDTPDDPYSFFDADGAPLALDPGSTWMSLVPEGSYGFDLDPEIAALVLEAEG
ncbi:MAG: DUF3048 domain-containing protein [Acidimicrobiales bacterium]